MPRISTDLGSRSRRKPISDTHGHRRLIARHLAAHGPQWGDAAAAAVGLTLKEWWDAVYRCPWFDLDGKGWVVTARGKLEAFAEEAKV